MYYIGVDLGGTNMAVGLVDENGKILHSDSRPTKSASRPAEAVLEDMADLILQVIRDSGHTLDEVKSIGVGSPGTIVSATAELVSTCNLDWHHVSFRNELQKYIDKPVYADNDANVAGLAEFVAGASQGLENSVFLTLGTGVGAGFVIGKRIYAGTHNVGAEIGHMNIMADGGEPCPCGASGCWERYASATALIREGNKACLAHPESAMNAVTGGDPEKMTAKVVLDAAKAGDPAAVEVFNNYVRYLALGIINIINILDPEMIVLGGGVSKAGDFLLNAVREEVARRVFYDEVAYASIELAQLGNDAGIIGAAMLGL